MPPIVKDLLLSKKFIAAVLTTIGAVAAYKGWNVDPMTILPFLAVPLAYIGAQGWADSGKEAAKINAALAVQLHPTPSANFTLMSATAISQSDDKPAAAVNATNPEVSK